MIKKIFHYGGNIAEAILAFALYSVLQVFYFSPKLVHKYLISNVHLQIVITAVITVLIMWFIFWMYKRQLKEENDWGFNKSPHWNMKRVWLAIIMFIVIIFANAALVMLLGKGQQTSTNQEELNTYAKHNIYLFKIMVSFIAPFIEEVIFRGMFFNTFFTKPTRLNKWLGIFVSGFLFAYMHVPDLSKFIIVYWMIGIGQAWIYLKTKDLRYSIIVHMGNNFISVLSMVTIMM